MMNTGCLSITRAGCRGWSGRLYAGVLLLAWAGVGGAQQGPDEDPDADGVLNSADNCPLVANPLQLDTNGDLYGNACDPDLDNNGAVDFLDLAALKDQFFQTGALDADFNSDGEVNFLDLAVIKTFFFMPPGPSGLIAQIDATPVSLDFGDVAVGAPAIQEIAVANPGFAPLQVSDVTSSDPAFAVLGPTSFTVQPGDPAQLVEVQFAPDAEQAYAANVQISSNAGLMPLVSLAVSGTGEAPPVPVPMLDVYEALEFGVVGELQLSRKTLTLGNSGDAPLSLSALDVTGAGFGVASLLPDSLPLTLAPGEVSTLVVSLTPAAGSSGTLLSGQLQITSDDPASPVRTVQLSAVAVEAPEQLDVPVVAAAVNGNLIDAAGCSDVSGEVGFSSLSRDSDTWEVVLSDVAGTQVATARTTAPQGAAVVAFSGLDACALLDGPVRLAVEMTRTDDGVRLPAFAGTLAAKSALATAPTLQPTPTVSVLDQVQLCGTAAADSSVTVSGGTRDVSQLLDNITTDFCLDVPLQPNARNTLLLSAVDRLAAAPAPVTFAAPFEVMAMAPTPVSILAVSSTPLTQAQLDALIAAGSLSAEQLSQLAELQFSLFTVSYQMGEPIGPPAIVQAVIAECSDGCGTGTVVGGGWVDPLSTPPAGLPGAECLSGCVAVTALDTPFGTLPGLVIVGDRSVAPGAITQVTLALSNPFELALVQDLRVSLDLPGGLTALTPGPASDVAPSATPSTTTRQLGTLGPGETRAVQFALRADAIGAHAFDLQYQGFVTDAGSATAFSAGARSAVEVSGSGALALAITHPSVADAPDILANEAFALQVQVTNTSSRALPYASLGLSVGANLQLLDVAAAPSVQAHEGRALGTLAPGQQVATTFILESAIDGEIVVCQATSAAQALLAVHATSGATDCALDGTALLSPQAEVTDPPPALASAVPRNGDRLVPLTPQLEAAFAPAADCLTVDAWSNVQTELAPGQPSGEQILAAQWESSGSLYLEQLDAFGHPVARIPLALTVQNPVPGAGTLVSLRPGLDAPASDYLLSPGVRYRLTALGADLAAAHPSAMPVCNALSLAPMANTVRWSFVTTPACSSAPAPVAQLLEPLDGALDRPLNQPARIEFSSAMDITTFSFDPADQPGSGFGVYANPMIVGDEISGGTAVIGRTTFADAGRQLRFEPDAPLAQDAQIVLRLSDAVTDLCGQPLQVPQDGAVLFSFSTPLLDVTAPPSPQVQPVPALTNLGTLLVTGSAEPYSTVRVSGAAQALEVQVGASGLFQLEITLNPEQANVLSVEASDAAGNTSALALVDAVNGDPLVVFYDTIAPLVNTKSPADGAVNVSISPVVFLTFSEAMLAASLMPPNIRLHLQEVDVAGTVSTFGDTAAIFVPLMPLEYASTYTLELASGGVTDLAGNPLASDFALSFTTQEAPPPVPEIVLAPSSSDVLTRESVAMTITLNVAAAVGGQVIDLASDDAGVVVPATALVAEGELTAGFDAQVGVAAVTAQITASAPGFIESTASITSQLRDLSVSAPTPSILQTVTASVTLVEPAPVGGASIALSSSDPAVLGVSTALLLIDEGLSSGEFDITAGPTAGSADVIADGTADGYAVSTVTLVTSPLGSITLGPLNPVDQRIGSTLQAAYRVNLDVSDHGGVTVRVDASGAGEVLLATSQVATGATFLDVQVQDGQTASPTFFVRALADALGEVTLSASQAQFVDGSYTLEVVPAAFLFTDLSANTTVGAPNDPFFVSTWSTNTSGGLLNNQPVAPQDVAGNGLAVTFEVSDPAVGLLVDSATPAGAPMLSLSIAPGDANSPISVLLGGVELAPIAAGSTDLTATAVGLNPTVTTVTVAE